MKNLRECLEWLIVYLLVGITLIVLAFMVWVVIVALCILLG